MTTCRLHVQNTLKYSTKCVDGERPSVLVIRCPWQTMTIVGLLPCECWGHNAAPVSGQLYMHSWVCETTAWLVQGAQPWRAMMFCACSSFLSKTAGQLLRCTCSATCAAASQSRPAHAPTDRGESSWTQKKLILSATFMYTVSNQ